MNRSGGNPGFPFSQLLLGAAGAPVNRSGGTPGFPMFTPGNIVRRSRIRVLIQPLLDMVERHAGSPTGGRARPGFQFLELGREFGG